MAKSTAPITPNQFRKQLIDQGITLKEWAESKGYKHDYCSKVLTGAVKGVRGLGHKIAVDMGIKAKPVAIHDNATTVAVGSVSRTNTTTNSQSQEA